MRRLRKTAVLVSAAGALTAIPLAPSPDPALGMMNMQFLAIKAPRPGNATLLVGTLRADRPSASAASFGGFNPNFFRITSGRAGGVVVMAGIQRVGSTNRYRFAVTALAPRSLNATGNEVAMEIRAPGVRLRLDQFDSVRGPIVGRNRRLVVPLPRLTSNAQVGVLGGRLERTTGTRLYVMRHLLGEAQDLHGRAGRATFLRRLAACCADR